MKRVRLHRNYIKEWRIPMRRIHKNWFNVYSNNHTKEAGICIRLLKFFPKYKTNLSYIKVGQNFIIQPFEWIHYITKFRYFSVEEVGCNTSIINFSMLNVKSLHVYTFMVLNKWRKIGWIVLGVSRDYICFAMVVMMISDFLD